jgi:hypothetical protein
MVTIRNSQRGYWIVTVELIAKQNRKLNYKKPRIEGQKFFLKKVNLKEQKKK